MRLSDDKKNFSLTHIVSRETLERFELYADLLSKWQKTQNLVSPTTIDTLWSRHFADSLQLIDLGKAGHWVDMGSGAGFPGLVVAIASPNTQVSLIESNHGKCAFMREVARQTGVNVTIYPERAEDVLPRLPLHTEVFSARALAPLSSLCEMIAPYMGEESVALFPKGRNLEQEISDAEKNWDMTFTLHPSTTDSQAKIIRIAKLEQRVS